MRQQANDLTLFAIFLRVMDLQVGDSVSDPETWRGVTWGLVEGFTRWQLQEGYAVPSVNVRLATVKNYARLALKTGVLTAAEYALIRMVQGYSHLNIPYTPTFTTKYNKRVCNSTVIIPLMECDL